MPAGLNSRARISDSYNSYVISPSAVSRATQSGPNKERTMKQPLKLAVLAMLVLAHAGLAQEDTLWVRVIFYDFYADGSNPEFNMDNNYGLEFNMVQSNQMEYDTESANFFGFDSIGKPVYNTANIRHNRYLKYWFRDWNSSKGGKGDNTIPNYRNDGSGKLNSPEIIDVGHDQSFKNTVVYDSLPFTYVGSGDYYTFVRAKPNYFFWIDGKGNSDETYYNGADSKQHNFAFTMELHTEFEHKSGLKFEFVGDDDVWLFIDGRLVMDLGGVHAQEGKTVNLDDYSWLTPGETYTFSLFYAERHTSESNISVFTNIISSKPQQLLLEVDSDTIDAGDSTSITALIYDQHDSLRTDLTQQVEWNIVPSSQKAGDQLVGASGSSTIFTGTQAYHTARVAAVYSDGETFLTDTADIYIRPGDASQVVIERASETTIDSATIVARSNFLIQADPVSIITMEDGDFTRYVYAV
ncbi:MAG: fibro-slime domain-containing protein, partial [Chitinivibrionales bacterium]|nr:fibro-slime domain-containing protein [Chitinivibrionales bacterium]MBD3396664.1 fibro-slime domain-containing protein [Chitinivibrionales bacterium]